MDASGVLDTSIPPCLASTVVCARRTFPMQTPGQLPVSKAELLALCDTETGNADPTAPIDVDADTPEAPSPKSEPVHVDDDDNPSVEAISDSQQCSDDDKPLTAKATMGKELADINVRSCMAEPAAELGIDLDAILAGAFTGTIGNDLSMPFAASAHETLEAAFHHPITHSTTYGPHCHVAVAGIHTS